MHFSKSLPLQDFLWSHIVPYQRRHLCDAVALGINEAKYREGHNQPRQRALGIGDRFRRCRIGHVNPLPASRNLLLGTQSHAVGVRLRMSGYAS